MLYEIWMVNGLFTYTLSGKKRAPSKDLLLTWINRAWNGISQDLRRRSNPAESQMHWTAQKTMQFGTKRMKKRKMHRRLLTSNSRPTVKVKKENKTYLRQYKWNGSFQNHRVELIPSLLFVYLLYNARLKLKGRTFLNFIAWKYLVFRRTCIWDSTRVIRQNLRRKCCAL